MKILKRQEFLATPDGTLYQEYKPCIFGALQIKYERVGSNDFIFQSVTEDAIASNGSSHSFELLEDAEINGTSLQMDFDCCGREGLFPKDDALYAVWEKDDILALIKKLSTLL